MIQVVDDCSPAFRANLCYQCYFCSRWALKEDWGPGWITCPWCEKVTPSVAEKQRLATAASIGRVRYDSQSSCLICLAAPGEEHNEQIHIRLASRSYVIRPKP